ncbi:MAG TPA: MFS transporter [Thermoanaerobaculia bacterium]|nr:MFS transporter [Thermoanaerobaculia bacterium]
MTSTHDSYAVLRIASFRWFILSIWTNTVGSQIQAVVVGWQVYAQTHDPLSLGLVGLAEALPFIGVALYAGHVADRADRKRVALVSQFVLLLCAVALLIFTVSPRFLDSGRIWPIYLVIFISGLARSFLRPALTALSAELIPRDLYANGVAWRSSTWQFAAVLGPAAGGFLYGFGSARLAYSVDAILLGLALFTIVKISRDRLAPSTVPVPIKESLTTGIRFVWSEKILLGAMTLDLFSVLFGGAVALLPIFASDILKTGPQGLGILRAAPAAGSVLTGMVLAHRPPMKRAGASLFGCVALFGLTMIGFGLSRSFILSVVLLALSGAVDNVSVVIRSTLLQVLTPGHMLGRVSAVNQIFIGSSNEIGAFESGVAAKFLGTVPSVVLGGVMTLVVVGLTAWRIPQLLALREIDQAA